MKKVAVILSGCGVFDGAEVNEAVLTMLYLEKADAQYQCFAPNIEQFHVINHLTGEEMDERRNVLVESARIARGEVKDLETLNADDFDALILPGGFGVAKNLCDFAIKGAKSTVLESVKVACTEFSRQQKPIAYLCIAPALIGHIHPPGTLATIGNDVETAAAIDTLGAKHQQCEVSDIVVDDNEKVISTPAYMLANSVLEAATGIEKAVNKLVAMS
ncbi:MULTISPECIES: isoprenoid biosynthesis glyoxalase ElbB [unclassified Pseudoalteromonas]|uniref:isoprenoid biosynthesis glyoxalase ElbB n=1 Tax=unclassified Pseudoalteromonas TaxID=194690 RepID=UPI0030155946